MSVYNNIFERWQEIIDMLRVQFPLNNEHERYISELELQTVGGKFGEPMVSLTVIIPEGTMASEYETTYKKPLISAIHRIVNLEVDDIYFITQSDMDKIYMDDERQRLVEEKLFDFAYNEAMNDTVMQKAYLGKKKDVINNSDVRKIVKSYTDDVVSGKHPDFYRTAKSVAEVINDPLFNFGNIQKLINMTIKYIYISCYVCSDIRTNFADCHCPMDRAIMKTVRNEYVKHNNGNKQDKLLLIPIGNNKFSIDVSKVAWSKIGFEDNDGPDSINVYKNFQEMVKILSQAEGLIPIEYDFIKWNS